MTTAPGTLYVVATPIGNLEDLTLRAARILREADLVVAEDTRVTARLLARLEVAKPLLACFEHSGPGRVAEVVERLRGGARVALVTDAGTPAISDPGAEVVRSAISAGIPVVPVPGPCAAAAGLSVAGLPADRFAFEGFLPRKGQERAARLAALCDEPRTVVLYEAPHRIRTTLADLAAALGPRPAVLLRELTKLHEEVVRGDLVALAGEIGKREPRGEYVLVLAGAPPPPPAAPADDATVATALHQALAEGLDRKAAIRAVARRLGLPRREAYRVALQALARRKGTPGGEEE